LDGAILDGVYVFAWKSINIPLLGEPGFRAMRSFLVAGLAFLTLTAFGPPPSDPGPSPTVVRIAEKNDFGWQPPVYNYGTTPNANGARTLPLGTAPMCSPGARELTSTECVMNQGDWGDGTRVVQYNDGCSRNWTETVACYKPCPPRDQPAGSPGQCMANNGSYGPGSQNHPYTNGCGVNWNVTVSCCVEGDVVTSTSACVPNSGTFGPGNITKNHANGCGRTWVENVSCEIPDPNPPKNPYDEIVYCLDFESFSVRKMPFDYGGWRNDWTTQYTQLSQLRWDNRHSCAYRFQNTPKDTVVWGSPWYCESWGHPNPREGYCYMENPRFANFVYQNVIEKAVRDQSGEAAMWRGQWNGNWGDFGKGSAVVQPAEMEYFKLKAREYDLMLEDAMTKAGHPDNPQRVY
jgi:hypothetical protein